MKTKQYEIIVQGEEADFGPIEATDIHDAACKTRELLAQRGVWGVEESFTANVTVRALSGPDATVSMPVECNVATAAPAAEEG